MHKDKLLKLATYLKTKVPKSAFDLQYWKHENDNPTCGFTACAIGWAAHDKLFDDIGLGLYNGLINPHVPGAYDSFTQLSGAWDVVRNAFGITHDQALHLFYQGSYAEDANGVCEVAARIEAFVEAAGALPKATS